MTYFKITSTTVIDYKQAQLDDLPLVMDILAEASVWLHNKWVDQWPIPQSAEWQQQIANKIQQGEMYTLGIVKNRFGVVGLSWSDPHWPDDGLAGYVHHMAVSADMHGQNLGGMMLFWAQMKAKQQGRQLLRLSCPAENGRLRQYFVDHNFTYRGQVTGHDDTVALYERDMAALA